MGFTSLIFMLLLLLSGVCMADYYIDRDANSVSSSKHHKKSSTHPRPKTPPNQSPPASPTPQPSEESLAAQFMMPQNEARANVGLNPLAWDATLEAFAQNWANLRAQFGNCYLQHSEGPYGENIFWGGGKAWSGSEAAEAWVSEKQYYDYKSNSCAPGEQCGHYTQIVWRDSQRIGCARVTCSSGDVFMTCNYDPPGNYIGEKPY